MEQRTTTKKLPEPNDRVQLHNRRIHIAALAATKLADGLFNPKLILSWLLITLGAPVFLLGLLVPIREAGALLPQMAIAHYASRCPLQKWLWIAGSLLQAVAVLGMAATAWFFTGVLAGWLLIMCLVVFAIARSVCSVSIKAVLSHTVAKGQRGSVSGASSSLAAVGVILFASLLIVGVVSQAVLTIIIVLMIAGLLWLAAAGAFAGLNEPRHTAFSQTASLREGIRKQLILLRHDQPLQQFIITRSLLAVVALAPPFIVLLASQPLSQPISKPLSQPLFELGLLVLAAALASLLSGYIWGRLSDWSSRKVLIIGSVVSAITLFVTGMIGWWQPQWLQAMGLAPALLFVLLLAYEGIRIARATHIVDMAPDGMAAAYAAVSNSVLGFVLLAGGLFSAIVAWFGVVGVLFIMAGLCLLAAIAANSLQEVQRVST